MIENKKKKPCGNYLVYLQNETQFKNLNSLKTKNRDEKKKRI